jgi:hypothetical protein
VAESRKERSQTQNGLILLTQNAPSGQTQRSKARSVVVRDCRREDVD